MQPWVSLPPRLTALKCSKDLQTDNRKHNSLPESHKENRIRVSSEPSHTLPALSSSQQAAATNTSREESEATDEMAGIDTQTCAASLWNCHPEVLVNFTALAQLSRKTRCSHFCLTFPTQPTSRVCQALRAGRCHWVNKVLIYIYTALIFHLWGSFQLCPHPSLIFEITTDSYFRGDWKNERYNFLVGVLIFH